MKLSIQTLTGTTYGIQVAEDASVKDVKVSSDCSGLGELVDEVCDLTKMTTNTLL